MANIKPLSDRILLKGVEKDAVTKSGIYIPETASKERPFIYEVVAIGPGRETDGKLKKIEDIKSGDKVLCGQYSGDEIKLDGEEYKIVGYDYILAVVN